MASLGPEHIGAGGAGALFLAGLQWGMKFLRKGSKESQAAGELKAKVDALERDIAEIKADIREGFRELRELMMRHVDKEH